MKFVHFTPGKHILFSCRSATYISVQDWKRAAFHQAFELVEKSRVELHIKSNKVLHIQIGVHYQFLSLFYLHQNNTEELWESQCCPKNETISFFITT